GGSGAAVIAGMVPIATATDTGGSIRIPGAFCGLAGLKPTNGVVDRDPTLCWPDLTTCGPLATTVDDLRLLLDVEAVSADLGPNGLPGRVVATNRFFPWGPLPADVEAAFQGGLDAVEADLGIPVEWAEADVIRSGNPDTDWAVWTAPELVDWLGRERAQASLELLYPSTRQFVEFGLRIPAEERLAVRRRAAGYTKELAEVLGEDTVIATPTLTVDGWLADGRRPGADDPGTPPEVYNTNVQNLTGLPAITVPAGRLGNGVPFGLQFTGAPRTDGMLLDLAEAWERARPWPRAADGYEPFEV
ncbi:MAG: amidase family protein, partial [Actinomycetota bacterium]